MAVALRVSKRALSVMDDPPILTTATSIASSIAGDFSGISADTRRKRNRTPTRVKTFMLVVSRGKEEMA
jgi:hypothetical protein